MGSLTTDAANLILVEILEKLGGTPSSSDPLKYNELLVDILTKLGGTASEPHKRNIILEEILAEV